MKLDQKYFAPFMGVMALITMIFIVISTFNFKDKQEEKFWKFTTNYEPLLSEKHAVINQGDSVAFGEFEGNKIVVVFWASWSEKSGEIMNELDELASHSDYQIIAATVKDATETVVDIVPDHDFLFIDAVKLFNDLKVPGIPSYVLIDEIGNVVDVTVGYRPGVARHITSAFEQ